MTTAIEIRTTVFKTFMLLLVTNFAWACSYTPNNPPQTGATPQTVASADSTGEGKQFKWESLQVLGTQLLSTKSWGQVNYNLNIKTGQEKQVLGEQSMPNDSLTDGIGGTETPKVNCK